MIQLSRPAGLKGIASALLLVALLGLQARIASAVPTFTPDTIGIDGQVSFRIARAPR